MSIKVVHSGPDTIKVSVETTPEVKVSNPVVNVVNVTGVVGGGGGGGTELPDLSENNIWVGDANGSPVAESYVFTQDYILNIPDQNGVSKSFGKYLNGDTVPAQGKTAMEVMIDAFQDTVNPEPSITELSQPEYGRGNFSDTVTLDFGILNNTTVSGTEGVSAVLEWGVNGYGIDYGGGSFTYNNTQVYFNAPTVDKPIDFTTAYSASNKYQVRLTVTEPGTDGGEATSTVLNASGSNNWNTDIFTISFTGTTGLDESITTRVRGNNASTLDIDISSKEPSYVNIYQIRVYGHASSSNSFLANSLIASYDFNNSSADISPTFNPSGNLSVYRYKVEVEDEHGFVTSETSSTINFYYETYYGLSSNSSYNVSMLTLLTADLFNPVPGGIDGIGPFSNIGQNTYVWIIYPSTTNITEISDGAELITGGFTQQLDQTITGLSGFATTYSVYRSNATGSFDNITLYIT